ncbi:MAG: DUF3558 domain-containing protein [Pseudonocardiaceae bacterium]
MSSDNLRFSDTGNIGIVGEAGLRAAHMRTGSIAKMIAAGSVIVLAGCGTGPPPQPVRSSSRTATSPIPPVKNPRDVAAVAHRTCDLLTPRQAKGFGLDVPPAPADGLFGTVFCAWTTTTSDLYRVRRVSISVVTNNPTLEVAYNQDRGLPSFALIDIAGYPALVSRSNADWPSCDVDIKLAERQSVSISYESKEFANNPQQSCEVAKQVAAAVVLNVPLRS